MATKNFIVPQNVTQVSSNFTASGGYSSVYSGYAVFRAADGYAFATPTLNGSLYTNYNVLVKRANGTTFDIKNTAYCTFSVLSDGKLQFTLKSGAQIDSTTFNLQWTLQPTLEQTARQLTTVENLQNCTISGLPSTVTDATALNLTLTANNGYKFDTAPQLVFDQMILDENGDPLTAANFTVSNDKITATLSIDLGQCNLDYLQQCNTITINATAAEIPTVKTVAITQNATNCTTNAPQNISETDTEINIICTAANGYQFDTAPTIMFYDGNGDILHGFTFTVLTSKLGANVAFDVSQFDDFADVETIILTATAAAIPQTVTVTVNAQNCTVNGVPQTVYPDTVLNLIANANSGYKFDTETPPQVYILDAHGNPNTVNFTLSENDTVAQCTVNLGGYTMDNTASVTITANAAAITPYVDKYGTINVYKVTTQNLTDFAAVRFKKEKDTPSDTSGYFQLIDLGDYVVSVKRFYCLISDVLTAYIKAGNYNTNIQAETPQNDNFIIDCGTVAIPMQNNSITDYQNSEIKIFLPFVGFVSLPSDYVGKTIALQYRVNIVNGDCLAVLSCNGIEIDFVQCTISNDVIFKTNKENNFSGNAEFNLQVLKGLQPYAVIKTVTDKNAQIFNADCLRVALSEISGYFAANEIENFISDTITETEKEILFNEIANGVFI